MYSSTVKVLSHDKHTVLVGFFNQISVEEEKN